ncbi:MAG TPA: PD-(D/E)XK nuclease family protein [Dehalococcoidales bacterium]|nr:PD-(D/E)XK nuclease family protein [Dehalococcoidales bacterium]
MRWSYSANSSFRKCPRQWFYKQCYSSSRANDPMRREAHRLSKLENIQAWRGKIVDTVISETIVPNISRRQTYSLAEAKSKANELFISQRAQRSFSDGAISFYEVEYGLPLTEEVFQKALSDIDIALDNFFAAEQVWEIIQEAKVVISQRPLSFKHGTASVMVVPDLITFGEQEAPTVLDWKVNTYPMRDYWLQLVTGAIALTKCNPHRDWPFGATRFGADQVKLLEVQLLSGYVRLHTAKEGDIAEVEDFIATSIGEMSLASEGCDDKNPQPKDYPVTSEPRTCQMCSFRKLCWESVL